MTEKKDIPIVRIAIYRLDIYRLLTLLLADKMIFQEAIFKDIGNDNFANEVNRLLVLVAVVTRQLLRNYPDFSNKLCGSFYLNYPEEKTKKELGFKKACSMIIHATDIDIDIESEDYFYNETISNEPKKVIVSETISNKPEKVKVMFYQGIITVKGEKKERAELDFKAFAKYCIKLSDKSKEDNNG